MLPSNLTDDFLGISFLYAIWHSPLVRSQLTLDDVDFTVLIATSVLSDLMAKCPPAEACRDAFSRMAKATIAMVEKSTGFGSASTLSSQPLNVPRSNYFADAETTAAAEREPRMSNQMTLPQFDMDLKALLSEEEIASRPLAQQFEQHTKRSQAARRSTLDQSASLQSIATQQQPGAFFTADDVPPQQQQSPTLMAASQMQQPYNQANHYSTTSPTLTLSNQNPFQPLAQTISQHSHSDFSFDTDMSFLDTFPVSDPSGQSGWGGGWNDFDMGLGFATGGTGGAGGGEWSGMGGAGVDMFDGFFFGGEGGNGGFG